MLPATKKALCIEVKNTNGKGNGIILTSDPMLLGKEPYYEVAFDVKTDRLKATVKYQLQFENAAGEKSYVAKKIELNDGYQTIREVVTLPKEGTMEKVRLRFHLGEVSGKFYLDDVIFQPVVPRLN